MSAKSNDSARELIGNSKVLTAKGGSVNISDELRKKLVWLEDGRIFISASHANTPDVKSFVERERLRGKTLVTELVSLEKIAEIYLADDVGAITGQGNNSQATRLRELITEIATRRGSDIHWVGGPVGTDVFFRIDGGLRHKHQFDNEYAITLLNAVYNAHSSKGDNRTQLQLNEDQDGRITSRQILPEQVESIRIVSGPLAGGFEQVWRLTYRDIVEHGNLAALGYTRPQAQLIESMARSPYGIVVVGGPTGSGKSTTIQTVLTGIYQRSNGRLNIYTIEEPVEMRIPGARQHSTATTSETEEDRRNAFVAAARRMFRSDPNVVMFGEVRDDVTAEIAVRTALGGRLVFTTLHGNRAIDLMLRVQHDLKVGRVLATDHNVFLLYVSQSLVPRLCEHCAIPSDTALESGHQEHTKAEIERILTSFKPEHRVRFAGKGCKHCDETGYKGRELVAEVIRPDADIMTAMRNEDTAQAMKLWLSKGNWTKRRVAHKKAALGLLDPLHSETHVGELAVLGRDGTPQLLAKVLGYGSDVQDLET
jgi:general secretion pathway protein E